MKARVWIVLFMVWAAAVVGVLALHQSYNHNDATGEPEWYQPLQIVNRKLDAQARDIKALQERVVTLENELEAFREDDPTKAALLRRWEDLGDE